MDKFNFSNSIGELLEGDIHKVKGSKTIFIVCHGFLASKDTKMISEIANILIDKNISVAKINFSGYGNSEGEIGYSSYVKQQDDLRSAIKFLKKEGFESFGLIGHSMGGSIALMVSEDNPDINWTIDIAGPEKPKRIKERRFESRLPILETEGKIACKNPVTGEEVVFYKEFFEDLKKVDVKKSVKKRSSKLLIIHGTKDKAVPIHESKEIFIAADNPKTFQIISGADHNFTAKLKELCAVISNWVDKWAKQD